MEAFSEEELKSIAEFKKEHSDCYRKSNSLQKVTGFTIEQSCGTGIGENTFITCKCCGLRKDITDYGCW